MLAFGLLIFAAVLFVALTLWRRRTPGSLRLIDAYERLNRSVGLAVENGTRLHVSLGRGNFFSARGGSALAGLAMLRWRSFHRIPSKLVIVLRAQRTNIVSAPGV